MRMNWEVKFEWKQVGYPKNLVWVNVSYKDWMFEVSWQTDGLDLLFGLLWIERLLADIQHCVVCVFCVDENAMCIYQSQNSNKERRESKWKRW